MGGRMNSTDWIAFGYCAAIVVFCVWRNWKEDRTRRSARMFYGNNREADK